MLRNALHSVQSFGEGSLGSLMQIVLQTVLQALGGQANG